MRTDPRTLKCQIAAKARVALTVRGDVVLEIQSLDGDWANYAFSPRQIQHINEDIVRALTFPLEDRCPNEKRST